MVLPENGLHPGALVSRACQVCFLGFLANPEGPRVGWLVGSGVIGGLCHRVTLLYEVQEGFVAFRLLCEAPSSRR